MKSLNKKIILLLYLVAFVGIGIAFNYFFKKNQITIVSEQKTKPKIKTPFLWKSWNKKCLKGDLEIKSIKNELNNYIKKITKLIKINEEGLNLRNYKPFAQKIIIKPDSKVAVIGDLHGEYKALSEIIKSLIKNKILDRELKIIKNNYLIFLGDIADRGMFGTECWTTLIKIKNTNPNRCVIIKGNHECISQAENDQGMFRIEFNYKYKKSDSIKLKALFEKIFNSLPSVLYVGNKNKNNEIWAHLSHASFDPRFNPKKFLSKENRFFYIKNNYEANNIEVSKIVSTIKSVLENVIQMEKLPLDFGFSWFDIKENPNLENFSFCMYSPGKIWWSRPIYSINFVENFLTNDVNKGFKLLIKGHDHPMPKFINNYVNKVKNCFSVQPEEEEFAIKDMSLKICSPTECFKKFNHNLELMSSPTAGCCNIGPEDFGVYVLISAPMHSGYLSYNPTYLIFSLNKKQNNWKTSIKEIPLKSTN